MSTQPLISIVTPCRNSIQFIERTILSIRQQTYKNIEFIVADGGSTDGTLDIFKKHSDAISWWVSEPDNGMYQAINKGLARASGEIISYLNSDDTYYPDTISNVVKSFQAHPQADFIYGNLNFIDEKDRLLYNQIYPAFSLRHFINANYSMIGQPASFWRRGLMDRIGHFDETFKMAGDFDFFVRAGAAAGNMIHVDETLAAFRVHAKSLTSRQLDLNFREIRQMRDKHDIKSDLLSSKISRVAYDVYFKLINYRSIRSRFFAIKRT